MPQQQHDSGQLRSAPSPQRWFRVTYALLVGLAVLLAGEVLASIPSHFALLRSICTAAECSHLQLTPAELRALEAVGLSLDAYAAYTFGINLVSALSFFIVAAALIWRTSGEWYRLLLAFVLLTVGASYTTEGVSRSYAVLQLIGQFLVLGWSSALPVICLFPDGRFIPRYTRVLVPAWYLVAIVTAFFPESSFSLDNWPPLLSGSVVVTFVGLALFAQIYRYRHVSGVVERQQTKWVVFGIVTAIAGALGIVSLAVLVPALGEPGPRKELYNVIPDLIIPLFLLLIPLSLGIAILRYRLYDIDILINRTLVYGLLTAALVLTYWGSVVLLQHLFQILTGQASQLAIVASTLAIAALFNPLRRRIQMIIDRRFYRRKYDAAQVLAAFAATARDEVDLDRLTNELVEVIEETLQPEHVSLWVKNATDSSLSRREP